MISLFLTAGLTVLAVAAESPSRSSWSCAYVQARLPLALGLLGEDTVSAEETRAEVEKLGTACEICQADITARSDRPTNRWISCVRPPILVRSRWVRSVVARGNMAYSAETQPTPLPLRNGGTRFSIVAVQITLVSPISMSAEPSAGLIIPVVIFTGRNCLAVRPSVRTQGSVKSAGYYREAIGERSNRRRALAARGIRPQPATRSRPRDGQDDDSAHADQRGARR